MSASTQQAPPQTVEPPTSEGLHRLAVEAGRYLGKQAGEPLLKMEIIGQGQANGYSTGEVRDMLAQEGYASAKTVPVPPQGNILGGLWQFDI